MCGRLVEPDRVDPQVLGFPAQFDGAVNDVLEVFFRGERGHGYSDAHVFPLVSASDALVIAGPPDGNVQVMG
ncbi:hypothetical protein GCM10018954_058850 [Kutzneria kofuensis]